MHQQAHVIEVMRLKIPTTEGEQDRAALLSSLYDDTTPIFPDYWLQAF